MFMRIKQPDSKGFLKYSTFIVESTPEELHEFKSAYFSISQEEFEECSLEEALNSKYYVVIYYRCGRIYTCRNGEMVFWGKWR